jgi:Mrp family chromosome partitioning ATPase
VSQPSTEKQWRPDAAHICIDNYIVEDFQTTPPSPHVALQMNDAVAGRIGAANRPQASRHVAEQTLQESFATIEELNVAAETIVPATEKPFPFVAAMEVEQFAWLPVVENLCLQQPTSFDRILTELKHEQRLGHRVIAVTSIKPGEGRTSIVQCLARRAAMQGLRVCIVDADHQYPQLAEQLGLQIDAGWEATLTSPLSINDLAVESLRDRICLVPMKQALPDEVIVEHGTTCGKWLANLKRDFDLVLIDAAPTYEIIDRTSSNDAATTIHPLASWAIDSWLLVRNVQETSLAELARWNRRAQSLKLNILGVLENRTTTESLATR